MSGSQGINLCSAYPERKENKKAAAQEDSVSPLSRILRIDPAVPALALLAHRDEIPVQTAGFHQFLMGAGLGDPAVRDHQDLIGIPDGVQPVGNDKQSLALAQLADGLLDVALVVGVHAGGGLVQNDDGGVF